eukprot:tig00020960_g16568.t1
MSASTSAAQTAPAAGSSKKTGFTFLRGKQAAATEPTRTSTPVTSSNSSECSKPASATAPQPAPEIELLDKKGPGSGCTSGAGEIVTEYTQELLSRTRQLCRTRSRNAERDANAQRAPASARAAA